MKQIRDQKIIEASNRAAAIREFWEDVIARQSLNIVSSRTFELNGRICTEFLIDDSRECGRGHGFRLVCGNV